MIPSIDSYLHNEIEEKLQIILTNRYIIEEILKDINPTISRNFIRAYAGEKGREIPIVYTMPQDKQTQQGAIYIGLREGSESDTSIGNTEGTYGFKEGSLIAETSVIHTTPEQDELYFEVSKPIGELVLVEGITFSASDNKRVEGNRIYFAYDPTLAVLTDEFMVTYVEYREEEVGLKQGFTATEHYSVLVVSTNMDTVRCLDLIVKSILIMMRANVEEHTNMLLQRLQFGQIEPVVTGNSADGTVPEILYGRETIVEYKTSYNLDAPLLNKIQKFIVQAKLKEENDNG
ncbi:hypothetical protein BCP78_0216 [Bacillus phage BCP78]|uniref:Uncharacterized protein n=3 Tax=Tsarbombavirus BCP78 TaxID=1985182 RepID=J9PRF3_9CAUD|nr:hypothetical protein BCP78_0216 [Bacillus phage BCP78]YP_009783578.1 hypothetical protein QLX27_gp205 [Bacillus phage BCU4]AEW47223.1 hypothetical protein BCP78_0216 [Bacillus phage BCP78]AEW47711.1 hypothetical protein BCU4_0205 [Bacillus phage BCU4]AQN32590.1 hypothetical protein BCP12_190 [Bacillus phage BCP12]